MPREINTVEDDNSVDAELSNKLLNQVIAHMKLKNDAALARALEVGPPVLSKIRHGRLPVGDSIIIRLHELTGLEIRSIKASLGRHCLTQKL